ncbi:MAG: DUF4153 domain-containing protein [Atopobiaceae bacterium]
MTSTQQKGSAEPVEITYQNSPDKASSLDAPKSAAASQDDKPNDPKEHKAARRNQLGKLTAVQTVPLLVGILICSAALGIFWGICVHEELLSCIFILLGGWAFTLSILGFFAAFLSFAALSGKLKRTGPGTLLTLTATVLASFVPAINANFSVRILGAFVLGILCIMCFWMIATEHKTWHIAVADILSALGFFFSSQLSNLHLFCHLKLKRGKSMSSILGGLACTTAILAVVIPLLSRADSYFLALVEQLIPADTEELIPNLIRLARIIICTAICASLLATSLTEPCAPKPVTQRRKKSATPLAIGIVLAALDLCYLIFIATSIQHLFGAAHTQTLAIYARSGFFELMGVATINLVVIGVVFQVQKSHDNTALLALKLMLVLTTIIMLGSAAWRMSLYVSEYGLSLLRLATFWSMATIAVLFVLITYKIFHPASAIFSAACAALVVAWLSFALMRPAALVATHNMDAYLSHATEHLDSSYFIELGPDALVALDKLNDKTDIHYAEIQSARLELSLERSATPWQRRSIL